MTIFNSISLKIANLSMTKNSANIGGCIFLMGCNINNNLIVDSEFIENHSQTFGGAIYSYDSTF